MIFVSQGHEKGIGLEVFFKSLALLPRNYTEQTHLFAFKKSVSATLAKLEIDYEIASDGIFFQWGKLVVDWLSHSGLPQSTLSFVSAIEACRNQNDILFTLPTTKEDLINPKKKNQTLLGHTEFLRSYFREPLLAMYFHSEHLRSLLLTDHLPLKEVLKLTTPTFVKEKLQFSLKAFSKLEPTTKRAIIAGLNPHAGEGGLLGKEDKGLQDIIKNMSLKKIKLLGLCSADSMTMQRIDHTDLLVYMYHDQGLGSFKSLMGTLGANITLGLPFIRLSVDHGTAFPLYGKNSADYRGAVYCFRKAMDYQERLSGQNSNYKSKSS